MGYGLFVGIGAALGLMMLGKKDADIKEEASKPPARPGQPSLGGQSPIPGVPSIPAPPGVANENDSRPDVIARMVAVLATASVTRIRKVAIELEKEGYKKEASELRAAATAIENASAVVVPAPYGPPEAPYGPPEAPGPQPVLYRTGDISDGPPSFVPPEVRGEKKPKVIRPPAAAIPLPVIKVSVPPIGSIEVSPPKPVDKPPVSYDEQIPDKATLVGRTALMLYQSGRGPANDIALLTAYKKSVGLKDSGKLYGPGTAKSLMGRGIVPPTPWDWPKNKKKSVKALAAQYKYKASQDSARREEWLQAVTALKGA